MRNEITKIDHACAAYQQVVKQAWNFIEKAKSITLLTHDKPDGDGISACAALAKIFNQQGKEVEVIYPDIPDVVYTYQANNVLINTHKQIPDLLVVCDTASTARMYYPDSFTNIPMINIDHHISNSINGVVNIINTDVSSMCEELYFFIKQYDEVLIDTYVASCLLSGILYDSQVFYTLTTSASTLQIAGDLIKRGADYHQIKQALEIRKDKKTLQFWAAMLSQIHVLPDNRAAWIVVTKQVFDRCNVGNPALAGFSNFFARNSDCDITMVFYEAEKNMVRVSLRSKVADVNKLAGCLGGGGHKHAAGITSSLPIDKVVDEVVGVVGKN